MKKLLMSLSLALTLCCVGCSTSASSETSSESISSSSSSESIDTVDYNVKTADLPFRDVCVLPDPVTQRYYMVGFLKNFSSAQEVAIYQSKDLENWGNYKTAMYNDGDFDESWAPELHMYKGEYYLFASLKKHTLEGDDLRGCYILKSKKAIGIYKEYSERITPADWQCLDGTLYVEDGVPYMVYCREWSSLQDKNGHMYYVQMKDDLTAAETGAEHKLMFKAKDNGLSADGVTDGPYMYKASNGDLVMIWSKYIRGLYTIVTARSKSGKLAGPWEHDDEALFTNDGGHAMIFTDFNGDLRIAFHTGSTNKGYERPTIRYLIDNNGKLSIQETK